MAIGLILLGTCLAGCQTLSHYLSRDLATDQPDSLALAGDAAFVQPLPGLDGDQLARYERGRALFERDFSPTDGLGPLYNNISCKACHGFPSTGGASAEALTLVAGMTGRAPRTLKEHGGPVISDQAIAGIPREQVPAEARAFTRKVSPPTYGEGLIEAIPAADLAANLVPTPRRRNLHISPRANWDLDVIGRFGWKAQTGDTRSFTVNAANFEMGLSSADRPFEFFPNLPPQALASPAAYPTNPTVKAFFDRLPDRRPDLSPQAVDDLTAFQRFQAPPPALALTRQAQRGAQVFTRVGCNECHVPAFTTGANPLGIPVGLDVPLYSDLLLHELGPALDDGITWMGRAGRDEFRTTPLWGLRFKRVFLHDGRTASLEEAVQFHAGEARMVTDAYNNLAPAERQALKAFLLSI